MSFPTPQEYNEAIQNPGASFRDLDLRSASVETTQLGLPRPITGNFASVYRMQSGTRSWAVRCFWREIPDLQERYAAISRHLKHASLPYTVGFDYLHEGIMVGGHWYPILKMEWVEGPLLHEYVEKNLSSPGALTKLAHRWLRMAELLEAASVAHGDLQHGNVVIRGDNLKLVDYDGMFVPALHGSLNYELGHPNYQHPLRDGSHFGPTLDRFSVWVVYVSLLALSWRPALWDDMNGGDECLLLRRSDFEKPDASRLFAVLHDAAPSPLSHLARRLEEFGVGGLSSVAELRVPHEGKRRQGDGSRPHRRHRSPAPPSQAQDRLPEWLHDYLPDESRHEGGTARSELLPRAALVALAFGLILAVAAAFKPLSSAIPLTAIAMALTASAFVCLLVDFGRSTRVRELNAVRFRWVRASLRHHCMTPRIRYLKAKSRRIDGRLQRLDARAADDLQSANGWKQRREAELSDAVALIRPALGRHMQYLLEGELEEKHRALDAIRSQHLQDSLRGQRLRSCRVEGLDARSKVALWCRGLRTAADVDAHEAALGRVSAPTAKAVHAWRSEVERRARRSEPDRLPPPVEVGIDRRYAPPLRALRAYLGAVERWERAAEGNIEDFYEGERARLEARLSRRRTRSTKDREGVERRLQEVIQREAQYRDEIVESGEEMLLLRTDTFPQYAMRLLRFR